MPPEPTIPAKHPRAIRWFHWIHFPLLSLMIWSGLLIYWADDIYGLPFLHFFPEQVYRALGLNGRLAEGIGIHLTLAWLFAINGLLYVSYTIASGEWRALVPDRRSFGEAIQVLLHDLRMSRRAPPPRKFNGAQQIAYTGVVLMGTGSLVTGLVVYKPIQLSELAWLVGGYEWARFEHFWLTVGYVVFFMIHVAQVARAGWNNLRAMITGYEIRDGGPS